MLGFEVDTFVTAQEALESAETNPPDLAILDIMLPDMSGYRLNQALKEHPTTAKIPVLIITALKENPPPKEVMREKGISGYLMKPFSMDNFSQTVQGLMPSPATKEKLQ